jgi:hypothetical protein
MRARAADALDVGRRVLGHLPTRRWRCPPSPSRRSWSPPTSRRRIRPSWSREWCWASAPSAAAPPRTARFWRGRWASRPSSGPGRRCSACRDGQTWARRRQRGHLARARSPSAGAAARAKQQAVAGKPGSSAARRAAARPHRRRAAHRDRCQHRQPAGRGHGAGLWRRGRGPIPHRVPLPQPRAGAGRRGAVCRLPRRGGCARRPPADHPHARHRRRQAPALPGAAQRGEPLPRLARHPLLPRPARSFSCRSCAPFCGPVTSATCW